MDMNAIRITLSGSPHGGLKQDSAAEVNSGGNHETDVPDKLESIVVTDGCMSSTDIAEEVKVIDVPSAAGGPSLTIVLVIVSVGVIVVMRPSIVVTIGMSGNRLAVFLDVGAYVYVSELSGIDVTGTYVYDISGLGDDRSPNWLKIEDPAAKEREAGVTVMVTSVVIVDVTQEAVVVTTAGTIVFAASLAVTSIRV